MIGTGQAGHCLPIVICLGLAACTSNPKGAIQNATGGDILLWPLSEQPLRLRPGEITKPLIFRDRGLEAFVERGNCLYTYRSPNYPDLPEKLRKYNPKVVAVIREDMALHVHDRIKKRVQGPEIVAPGYPLRPTAFCGQHGQR
ncbi:MAG TPA: hypothetical protein VGB70_15225 [Allosphingosinicella sp.]|jgi:hypothetical protein